MDQVLPVILYGCCSGNNDRTKSHNPSESIRASNILPQYDLIDARVYLYLKLLRGDTVASIRSKCLL